MLVNWHVDEIAGRWQRTSASLKFRTRKPFAKCRVLIHNVVMQKIRLTRHDCLYGSCRRLILLSAIGLLGLGGAVLRADQIIYDDTLQNGWVDNYSWATVYPTNSPVHTGSSSISVSSTGYQALYFHHTAMAASLFTNITFWINGGSGGQNVNVQATSNGVAQAAVVLAPLPVNSWRQETISLASLGVATLTTFDGFWLQVQSSGVAPTFYVDDLSLSTNAITAGTNAPVSITVNASVNRHSISPLIYGVAFASSNQLSDLNLPLNRSGGNNETRYNWQISAHNLDADYYFESYPDANATPGSAADDFVANSKASGAQPMITVPMIGWAPKLGPGRNIIWSYSVAKYGAQTSVDQYRTDAGNGKASPSGTAITNNDPNDANFPTNSVFEQTYVQHLINRWGSSTNGGVPYFIMDNEHSLWQSTHQDIHPVGPTMQEIRDKIFDYASMVKSNDPNALVCGPEEWGWPGYLYSGYDQQWSGAHNDYNPADYPDRIANGGWDYMPWLLNQLHQYETNTGVRLLDYFTLHCYPQEGSVSGNAVDSATELLRNQSTRVFWDPNYVDPSWINNIIMLIPRMKNWVTNYNPGTKIGITEYNWGAESSINGATAQADILGIFGRENLDLATRWTTPDASSPTYKAIKMYRNYDGNKSTFGDTSILTSVPNPDNLSAFSAVRTADGVLTLMVINKDLNNATPVNASITNFTAAGTAQRWLLTSGNAITRLADISLAGSVLEDTVPTQSITLYVLPGVSQFSLKPDTAAAPGQLTIWLNGQAGLAYELQASADLVHWSAFATNTLMSNSFPFLVSTTNTTMQFYRGLWSH
jgi:Glycoside hydrolase family 44